MTVLLIYGILCFAFQMASRREATREMTRPMFMANLRRLFPELEGLPHHDTLARILEQIEVSEIEQAHLDMIRHLISGKKFVSYLIAGCYPIAIDGTQKFTQKFKRSSLWDEACLERKVRTNKNDQEDAEEPQEAKQYYVHVLEANLAFRNGMVIPLLSVVLGYTEGDNRGGLGQAEGSVPGSVGTMIALTPQMRILVAVEPIDFRNYPECRIMWSSYRRSCCGNPQNGVFVFSLRLGDST